MSNIILLFLILSGLVSCSTVIISKVKGLSLEKAFKELNNFLLREVFNIGVKDNSTNIPDFIQRIWYLLKTVDEETYTKISKLLEMGNPIWDVQHKGDHIYEIKWLFPCQNCDKAEVEAIIRGMAPEYGFLVFDCSWKQIRGRLEAVCIKIDTSGGKSEQAQQIISAQRDRLIASLEPPEDDYDDEL